MGERSLDFFDLAPMGFLTLDGEGLILEANRGAETLLAATRDSLASLPLGAFVHPDHSTEYSIFRDRLAESRAPQSLELRMMRSGGSPFWARLHACRWEAGGALLCRVVLSDVSEERLRHEGRELAAKLIVGLLEPGNFRERMSELSGALREWTGCEAVGIRLRDGEDYPYYETRGFPPEFVEAERRLCAYGPDGGIVRDGVGNPVLECMCGNVLCGRFDPTKSFFSARGSFWSNCTTALLASTTDADRQARTRNRCNGEGFESVALVALRVGDEVLGLLQFNDRRRDRFSAGLIADCESMADGLAIALSRRRAEEALEESERRYRTVADFTWDWETWRSPEGDFLYVSPSCDRITGYSAREFMGDPGLALGIALEKDRSTLEEHYAGDGRRRLPAALIEDIVGFYASAIPVEIDSSFEDFRLGMIVNEIATNSMKYAFAGRKSGRIVARASLAGARAAIALGDDGIGLPASVGLGGSAGFGLNLVRSLVEQIDGQIEIGKEGGTTYRIEFDLG